MTTTGEEILAQLTEQIQALNEEGIRQKSVVVIQRERTIPKFDNLSRIGDFEKQVRATWAARPEISQEEKLDLVWSNLSSSIRDELLCHPRDIIQSAENILGILRAEYGEKRSINQLVNEFHCVVQRPVEEVREYSHRLNRSFLALIEKQEQERIQPSEERMLRDQFISQLNNGLLRRLLRERVHQNPGATFLKIREEAIRWTEVGEEPTESASTRVVSAKPQQVDMTEMMEKFDLVLSRIRELEDKIENQSRPNQGQGYGFRNGNRQQNKSQGNGGQAKQRLCFKCGKPGHFAKFCQGSEN